jgi:hypothetical protein
VGNASEPTYDAALYAGADPHEEDDLSGLDRGDNVGVAQTEGEAPSTEPAAEPAGTPEAEAPSVEQEPEAPAQPGSESEPEAVAPRKDIRIPKERFDEVNERRKAAERRAQELEARLAQHDPAKVTNFDFDAKEQEYLTATLDGDFEKAKALRREIRAAEQTAFAALAEQRANVVREATKAELEFQQTVAELNSTYPVFDPNAEGYRADLVDEALELHSSFLGRGYAPAAALRKAVLYVARANGVAEAAEQEAPKAAALKAAAPKEKAPAVKAPNIKQKLETAAQQPPKQQGRGTGTESVLDVATMTEEDFDALPESTLRQLRGDVF